MSIKSGTALKNILSYKFPKAPPAIHEYKILSILCDVKIKYTINTIIVEIKNVIALYTKSF